MFKLVQTYTQLLFVSLPIRFFLKNFKFIKLVCENNEEEWK